MKNAVLQEDAIFYQIFERIRDLNPDFPMDYVLALLPDLSSCHFRVKNLLTGVVACLTAIWTERVEFKNKQTRFEGEEWNEMTAQEFVIMVEKVANDFVVNPELTHRVLSYIDASNVNSRVYRLYIEVYNEIP